MSTGIHNWTFRLYRVILRQSSCYSKMDDGDQNNERIYTTINDLSHLVHTSWFTIKYICCLVVILFDLAMFVSIIRQSLRRQKNARNGNDNIFVMGIFFLSFSYLMVVLLTILGLIYFETFPMEFVCQCYITVVVIPHAIFWLNMQENE